MAAGRVMAQAQGSLEAVYKSALDAALRCDASAPESAQIATKAKAEAERDMAARRPHRLSLAV